MDEKFMKIAIAQAKLGVKTSDEVPIGAVIVKDGKVIAKAHNLKEKKSCANYHAEMVAIEKACKKIGDWRLLGCDMYVTLEPCPMCVGAIMNSRIRRVIYGAKDPVKGACGSVIDLFSEHFPDKAVVYGNILGKESGELLSNFFNSVREEKYN